MFFCEFYKIFKNTFFTEHLRATAFECSALLYLLTCFCSRPTALQHWLNEICHSEKIVLLNVSPLVRRVLTPEKTPILYCYIGKTDAQSSSLVLQPPSLHSIKFFYFIRSCSFQHYFMLTICSAKYQYRR